MVGHTSGVDSKFEEEFVATLGILELKDFKKKLCDYHSPNNNF